MTPNEALKRIRQETCPATYMQDFDKEECCNIIEKALLELKAIKEAKPSEALEKLKRIRHIEIGFDTKGNPVTIEHTNTYPIIYQALLKSQEQEKVLEIIKNKCLFTNNLRYATFINYEYYKEECSNEFNTEVVKIDWNDKKLLDYLKLLTEQEFDLLKRWFK